jgi:hypothetical protein
MTIAVGDTVSTNVVDVVVAAVTVVAAVVVVLADTATVIDVGAGDGDASADVGAGAAAVGGAVVVLVVVVAADPGVPACAEGTTTAAEMTPAARASAAAATVRPSNGARRSAPCFPNVPVGIASPPVPGPPVVRQERGRFTRRSEISLVTPP